MTGFLGFDTSNYTTSVALYVPETGELLQQKRLLPVKAGERGLRQSDAVFHHTAALPELTERLFEKKDVALSGVCASVSPRKQEGSYMPCFLVGAGAGRITAATHAVPLFETSHQHGHIAAALFGSGRLDLLKECFLAFHVSGGTTEALLVEPDEGDLFRCNLVASSLDLKAGQAVDRVGVMLGFPFPAGKYVDAEARKSSRNFTVRVPVRDGCVSLSGLQNQCARMQQNGECAADICRYCLLYIEKALEAMADHALQTAGDLPLVFSGGVTSSTLLREMLCAKYACVFAQPEYACDNAAGTAFLACWKHTMM